MRQPSDTNKDLILVISPDKGLCGGLITSLLRKLITENDTNKDILYLTIGKKLQGNTASLGKTVVASFNFGTTLPSFDAVYPIIKIIDEYFLEGKVKQVKIIYTNFANVVSQKPEIRTILPIQSPLVEQKSSQMATLFEPKPDKILQPLQKHYLEMTLYQYLIESFASEQAARMIAMKNATDNAFDVMSDLKLEYNKGRQEKITNEILDIGSAAFTMPMS